MFKTRIITSILFSCGLSHALAGSFYMGPGLNYENVDAGSIRYQDLRPILIGGYGGSFGDGFYLAGELFVGPKAIDISNKPNQDLSLKAKYSYGSSVIPSLYLDEELMIYSRFGMVITKFQSFNTEKNGWVIGVGLQTQVMNCWHVRGEYDYVRYNSISNMGTLHANEFNIAAIYQFNGE